MTLTADHIAGFLDQTLQTAVWTDKSHNGLQVANQGVIKKICCGVDAGMEFFREANRRGGNLLVCHHGLSWGDSLKHITDLNYQRVKFLLDHNMALYASHLPLDAHPEYGNNAQICKMLGLQNLSGFGCYQGVQIGFCGELLRAEPYESFKEKVKSILGTELKSMDFGPKSIRSAAVVSGGAADLVEEAGRSGIDVFLSGEPQLLAWNLAQEYGVNALFGGHYATETFGVKALAELLAREFQVPTEFIDFKVPY